MDISELETKSRKELQSLAKMLGIKANLSSKELILQISVKANEKEEEEEGVKKETTEDVKLNEEFSSAPEVNRESTYASTEIGTTVEVFCENKNGTSTWEKASIKRVNKKSVRVIMAEDGKEKSVPVSDIRSVMPSKMDVDVDDVGPTAESQNDTGDCEEDKLIDAAVVAPTADVALATASAEVESIQRKESTSEPQIIPAVADNVASETTVTRSSWNSCTKLSLGECIGVDSGEVPLPSCSGKPSASARKRERRKARRSEMRRIAESMYLDSSSGSELPQPQREESLTEALATSSSSSNPPPPPSPPTGSDKATTTALTSSASREVTILRPVPRMNKAQQMRFEAIHKRMSLVDAAAAVKASPAFVTTGAANINVPNSSSRFTPHHVAGTGTLAGTGSAHRASMCTSNPRSRPSTVVKSVPASASSTPLSTATGSHNHHGGKAPLSARTASSRKSVATGSYTAGSSGGGRTARAPVGTPRNSMSVLKLHGTTSAGHKSTTAGGGGGNSSQKKRKASSDAHEAAGKDGGSAPPDFKRMHNKQFTSLKSIAECVDQPQNNSTDVGVRMTIAMESALKLPAQPKQKPATNPFNSVLQQKGNTPSKKAAFASAVVPSSASAFTRHPSNHHANPSNSGSNVVKSRTVTSFVHPAGTSKNKSLTTINTNNENQQQVQQQAHVVSFLNNTITKPRGVQQQQQQQQQQLQML